MWFMVFLRGTGMSSMMVTMLICSLLSAILCGGIGVILGISHGVRLGIIMVGIGIILIWGFRIGTIRMDTMIIGITLIGILRTHIIRIMVGPE
jgi:hypothetical protein